MATLIVPAMDEEPWPTLGPQVCQFVEERGVYGPGSLQGQSYEIDPEFRAVLYRLYEVFPRTVRRPLAGGRDVSVEKHPQAGRRRFKRGGLSVRKGLAKTEKGALVVLAELHPEGPVRADGFDAQGDPVGRPVVAPYIPMLAVTVDQVEELGYGALKYIIEEGPDADLFDVSLERIIRLGPRGQDDGKAVPLANSPGARDGARTTLNFFDEPHRLYLPRQRDAHSTMDANLPKRPLEDPWSLYVGTAGEPGQDSVAEDLHKDALNIHEGRNKDPRLFYLCRWAGTQNPATGKKYDLKVKEDRLAAISEATGPAGEFGPGQFEDIAEKWEREGADHGFLERVWLNRWTRSNAQAFDPQRWQQLRSAVPIPDGAFVAGGFDGARFRDATGIVLTDIATGRQQLFAGWERPLDVEQWEVPEAEVTAAWEEITRRFKLWRCYGDPPHWTETYGAWAARWPDQFEEWWTARPAHMSRAVREYREAQATGAVTHYYSPDDGRSSDFERHIAAAGRKDLNFVDDDGAALFILQKLHPDRKFDYAMAGCLSWKAYLDAVKSGAKPPPPISSAIRRVR